MLERRTRKLSGLAIDLTNYCNCRCSFCISKGLHQSQQPRNISAANFSNFLNLLPLLERGAPILLGCAYEATLHPQFLSFLEQIPPEYVKQVLLTTNLARVFSPEEMRRLASSGIGYVNVSLETYDKATYRLLMGVEPKAFYDNLKLLQDTFSVNPAAPKILLTTMVLRTNYDGLVELAKRAHAEIAPATHSFRCPFNDIADERLDPNRLLALKKDLDMLGDPHLDYSFVSANPPTDSGLDTGIIPSPSHAADPVLFFFHCNFQIDRGSFRGNEYISFGSNAMDHALLLSEPVSTETFSEELLLRQASLADRMLCREPRTMLPCRRDDSFRYFIEHAILWDNRFLELSGWVESDRLPVEAFRIVLQQGCSSVVYAATKAPSQHDAAAKGGREFFCLTDLSHAAFDLAAPIHVLLGAEDSDVIRTEHYLDLVI